MSHRYKLSRLLTVAAGLALAIPLAAVAVPIQPAVAATVTTAWQNGVFSVNTGRGGVPIGRRPRPAEHRGLAVAAAGQRLARRRRLGGERLHRPAEPQRHHAYRLSPGQVQIPGLSAMTSASNFSGTLDLYNGVLDESGGGMTMQAWVPAGKDELIVNVTGANPSTQETADAEPVERPLPDRRRVRRDRQPGPDLGGQLPDRQLGADLRRDGRDHRGRAERHRVGRQLHRGAGRRSPRTPTARSGSSSRRPSGPAATPPSPRRA